MNKHREPLVIDYLIPEHQRHTPERRRVSVGEHEQFQKHLAASLGDQQPDPIDEALSDPIHDHAPACRGGRAKSRPIDLLDALEGRAS
jgi:hypothetical protein